MQQLALSELDEFFAPRRSLQHFFPHAPSSMQTFGGTAPLDVIEGAKEVTITCDLPGIRKEDINLTVKDNVLSVSGERSTTTEKDSADHKTHISERTFGSFERRVRLPKVFVS